jgi:hypothetical protein
MIFCIDETVVREPAFSCLPGRQYFLINKFFLTIFLPRPPQLTSMYTVYYGKKKIKKIQYQQYSKEKESKLE